MLNFMDYDFSGKSIHVMISICYNYEFPNTGYKWLNIRCNDMGGHRKIHGGCKRLKKYYQKFQKSPYHNMIRITSF